MQLYIAIKKIKRIAMSGLRSSPGAAALAAGRALSTSSEPGARSDTSTSTVSTVESEMSELQSKYNKLERKYRQLESKNKTSLESQLKQAKKEIKGLKTRVLELETKNRPKDPYDSFPGELLPESKSEFLPYKLEL